MRYTTSLSKSHSKMISLHDVRGADHNAIARTVHNLFRKESFFVTHEDHKVLLTELGTLRDGLDMSGIMEAIRISKVDFSPVLEAVALANCEREQLFACQRQAEEASLRVQLREKQLHEAEVSLLKSRSEA